jgi:hypothetical protein
MVSKLYDGSNWKNINGLKLYNGSAWKNAVRGWMWNGSVWKQWYPEYPINTAAPTVSGTATQGNTLSCTTGSWNSNLAYSPASYSYQWRRASSDISGATSSTYSTVVADVGNAISCRVTATNNRGSTPIISSNSITVTSANVTNTVAPATSGSTYYQGVATVNTGSWNGSPNQYAYQWFNASNGNAISGATSSSLTIPASVVGAAVWCRVTATNTSTGSSASAYSNAFIALPTVTGLSVSDGTITPGAPSSVTVTATGQTTASVSWGAGTNISFYDVAVTAGTGSVSNVNSTARTASITGGTAGGSVTVGVRSANYNGRVSGSWNSISGTAVTVTYWIYIDGSFVGTTTSNSYVYVQGNTAVTKTMQVVAYVGDTQGSSASGSASLSTKYSGYTSGSATYNSAGVAPSTPTNLNNTYSSGPSWSGSWSPSSTGSGTITYYWTLYQSSGCGSTITATASGNTTGTSFSQSMQSSNGLYAYFTVYASNSVGSSGTATSSCV